MTQERKYFEMPCKVNKSITQLMNRPLTMLLGYAAAAGGLCKDKHFWCVELKSEKDIQKICDWCSACKVAGYAGIILVNFRDDVSLSEASWKIVLGREETVVVVPKCSGVTLLEIFGSDMQYSPDSLTRSVSVKIYPKRSGMCHQMFTHVGYVRENA